MLNRLNNYFSISTCLLPKILLIALAEMGPPMASLGIKQTVKILVFLNQESPRDPLLLLCKRVLSDQLYHNFQSAKLNPKTVGELY